ncbi:AI-2E family transporter [Novosphingobium cyanobacteriorum]|uniref:AI-2E family transporter n=1 Tax=Novosphingobium cyanobacteriorum TaxID=3024215 RepID=A0ABT6CF32_9SPHN|nr:AI-2E family transporter [Novosphingobium cyanobacteriorum]MDF8332515.1 AI-2E family transporter [Novosphingobium cyanobacteriorum]
MAGPTDIQDDVVRSEAKKAAVWIGTAALVALAVFLAQPLLVIFGGIVFAAMIDGGQRLLARVAPIPRGLRIAIVLMAAVAFLVWLVFFAGNQIAAQAAELPAIINTQAARLLEWANSRGITVQQADFSRVAEQLIGGVGPVTKALGGIFGGFTTAFLIMILGIYFVLEPDLYQRGLAWMLPEASRAHWHGTAHRMGRALRMLLFGRLIGMAVEGIATWALLAVYGVPMAALLGLLTGLLAFLPNIGAPISGALMVLVGFSGGTNMGIYCMVVYLVVQTVDGNIIVPMVAKRTADLAPALVLGAQLIMGVMFGILGLALADPIVAMLKIALERQAERNDRAATEAAEASEAIETTA